jgi:putative oxidoreductase
MRIAGVVARYLLGFVFVVFSLNGFLHFIPAPPPPGIAGQFFGSLYLSHYLIVIFLLQLISGILLLVNRFVPLALTLLGPIIVNIFFFHALMSPSGLPLAVMVIVLWFLTARNVRAAFVGLLQARVEDKAQI